MAAKSLRDELSAAIKNVRSLADLIDDEDGAAYVRDVIRPLLKIRDRLPKAGTAAAVTLAALLSSGCADLKAIAEGFAGPCNPVSEEAHRSSVNVRDAATGRPVASAWRAKDGTVCAQTY